MKFIFWKWIEYQFYKQITQINSQNNATRHHYRYLISLAATKKKLRRYSSISSTTIFFIKSHIRNFSIYWCLSKYRTINNLNMRDAVKYTSTCVYYIDICIILYNRINKNMSRTVFYFFTLLVRFTHSISPHILILHLTYLVSSCEDVLMLSLFTYHDNVQPKTTYRYFTYIIPPSM